MNPVFAALAAVAFGLTLVGADASAAPAPAHSTSAHKAGQAAKPAKSSPEKAAKAASSKPAKAAKATKEPAAKSARPVKEPSAKTAKAAAQKDVSPRAEGRKGKAARQAASASAEPREARESSGARKTVKEVRVVKGRKVVVERSVPATRESRSRRSEGSESPAPRSSGAIGREAFVPSSPPIPRAEAVRQIQSRNALPPIPAPNVPIPPPRVSSPTPQRSTVTLQPPAAEVARAQARAPEAPVAAVTPPVEAPRTVPRYAAGSAELSGPEAAAAAAASLNAVQPSDPAPQRPAPVSQPVTPAQAAQSAAVPAVAAPAAAAAVAAPASVQSQPAGRTPKGTPRAYAMDGATFYQGGRKIRVQGLDIREPGMTSEHATQRLQRALDSGSLSVEPVEVDASGHTIAVVRVNGRNVAETVRAAN